MNKYWQEFVRTAGHLLFDLGKADYCPLLFGGEKLRSVFRDSPVPLQHVVLVVRISDQQCGDADLIFEKQVDLFLEEASRNHIPEMGRAEIRNEDGSTTVIVALVAEQRGQVGQVFEQCVERVLREMPAPRCPGAVSPSYVPWGEHAVESINSPLSLAKFMGPKLTERPN